MPGRGVKTTMFGKLITPRVSWREAQSRAAEKASARRRGGLGKEAVKTLRGVVTEFKELAKGVPRVWKEENTLRQIARRAGRKAWKVQTGRIKRK